MSLQYTFRVAVNTICTFVPEVCEAIIEAYCEEAMPFPRTQAQWKRIASDYERKWNSPHTIGAIDGKHIAIRCPNKGGSRFYNYKGFHSVVLMAVVDANYRFIYVDVGQEGRVSDGGVFRNTPLRRGLERNCLSIPPPEPITEDGSPLPYFLVGDEAFPLKTWLMKPYPRRGLSHDERIYNYRLCRARRLVEKAFGIMVNR